MNIAHQYVTYEIAKLLKEIGFAEKCSHYYVTDFQNFKADGLLKKTTLPEDIENDNVFYFVDRSRQHHLLVAPEIWQVVEWLRVKHAIWISCDYMDELLNFYWTITDIKTNTDELGTFNCDTPEEAYLAAITYILTKLI